MNQALTIAIRYAAVRKQFGPGNGKDEVPIIEYQLHVNVNNYDLYSFTFV
jgi:hypothetical protein